MHVDPSDARLTAFYERMIYWDLPLLTHTGQERSFTSAKDELSDPDKLRLPLELGVQVIAAHVASTGMNEGERDMDRLERMMRVYPNLYADISSLTQVNKLGYLKEVLQNKEFEGRLLYGSDFPLINTALVSPWLHPLHLTRTQMQELSDVKNPWDRDVALKQALGVPKGVFTRYQHVLDRWSFGPSGKGAEGL
jgi:predicted TIM-barrel fold metal-dependent hydrolase